MAQRNLTELLAGAAVLLVAAGFLGYAVANTGRTPVSGYALHARFDKGLETPHVREADRPQGSTDPYTCGFG